MPWPCMHANGHMDIDMGPIEYFIRYLELFRRKLERTCIPVEVYILAYTLACSKADEFTKRTKKHLFFMIITTCISCYHEVDGQYSP